MDSVISRSRVPLAIMLCIMSGVTGPSRVHAQEQQLRAASVALAAKIKTASKRTVAVVDFTDLQMNVTELGRFLAEEFQGAISNDAEGAGFAVVDRTHLKALLQEHKLASSGVIDPATARRLGEIAGVDCLVTGSLTPLGDSVRLSIKVLDTNTARVIGVASTDIPKTEAIASLLSRDIADGGNPGGGGGDTPADMPRGSKGLNTTVDAIRFDVTLCKHASDRVRCDVKVTNTGTADVDLWLWVQRTPENTTRAYDAGGVIHNAVSATFGGLAATYEVKARLIAGVPTPLVLNFDNTPAASWAAVYIRMDAGGHNNNWKDAVLRNVPIVN